MPKKINQKHPKTLSIYSLHLPLILLLVALIGLSGFLVSKYDSKDTSEVSDEFALVLGDDDDDDDNSGSGKSDDDDDDDDDDNSGSGKSDDDDDGDDDDNSGSGKSDDDDNDDDDKSGSGKSDDDDDDDDSVTNSWKGSGFDVKEDDDEDRTKTLQRVANDDGTFTVTEYEEKDDGEIKVEIRTFDANGNKIRVEKFERDDDGDEKSRVKVYDEFGNKLSDFRLETDDGKELELRIKEGETELSRVIFDVEKGELVVKTEDSLGDDSDASAGLDDDHNRLRIRLLGNNFQITRNGASALSSFPMTIDDSTGEILVSTPSGEVTLNTLPDTIVESVGFFDDSTDVQSMELVTQEELEYRVTGVKAERLLGVFEVNIPTVLIYDVESGMFLRSEDTFTTRVLDLFSF